MCVIFLCLTFFLVKESQNTKKTGYRLVPCRNNSDAHPSQTRFASERGDTIAYYYSNFNL